MMIKKNLPGESKPNEFCVVTEENKAELISEYEKITSLEYSFRDQFRYNHSISNFINSIIQHLKFKRYRQRDVAPLIKDPFSVFSTEWLVEKFNMKPILLIRHPGPIFDSYNRLNWKIDFNRFIRNMKKSEVKSQLIDSELMDITSPSTAQEISVLWSMIYQRVSDLQEKYPDWLFIRYEDLFLNIEANFGEIFDYLDLNLNDDILAKIYYYTSRGYFPKDKANSDTRLERQDLLHGWRRRVSEEQINELQTWLDYDIYRKYYSDENWMEEIKY